MTVQVELARPIAARSSTEAWRTTWLLAVCFALSYVDRQVMSLLVTPIKASLGLSDSQIGLLQGVSFSLFYVVAALPLARLADRSNRSRLTAVCVAVWSLMTMACGLAASFWQLMLARIGLAVAEAGLPPAALTLMADVHSRQGLARATSLFMLAPFVGGGLALIGGGALYATISSSPGLGLEPWQIVFIVAGLPGLLLAPAILVMMRDPRSVRSTREAGGSIADLSAFILGNWRFCVVYIVAIALVVTILNAHIAWMPTAILRSFPIGEAAMGATFGITYLVAGSAGTIVAGWVVARTADGDMLGSTLRQMRFGATLLALPALLAPFAPVYWVMIALAGVAVFCTSAVVSMGSIPFQLTAPLPLRAQAIALSSLAAALLGTGFGPLLVGVLSDAAAELGATRPLSLALALVGGAIAPAVATLMSFALRHAAPVQPATDNGSARLPPARKGDEP